MKEHTLILHGLCFLSLHRSIIDQTGTLLKSLNIGLITEEIPMKQLSQNEERSCIVAQKVTIRLLVFLKDVGVDRSGLSETVNCYLKFRLHMF